MNASQGANATLPPLPITGSTVRWHRIVAIFAISLGCIGMCVMLRSLERPGYYCPPSTMGDLQSVVTGLKIDQMINGSYPATAQGLRALVEMPTSEPRPRRWYQIMTEVPKDRWGHEYVYVGPGGRNGNGLDLRTLREDGVRGTADDIVCEPWPRRASAAR